MRVFIEQLRKVIRQTIWSLRPWKCRINIKERCYLGGRFDPSESSPVRDWLNENAVSGWRCVGYVRPKPEEIERRYHDDGNGRRLITMPDAFLGIEFKSSAEAVMFKMVMNDL